MTATVDRLTAARAAALFASDLSATAPLHRATIHAAITHAVRSHGGSRGCAAEVAFAYGDHPEVAAPRMRWALSAVGSVYTRSNLPPVRLPAPRKLPVDCR